MYIYILTYLSSMFLSFTSQSFRKEKKILLLLAFFLMALPLALRGISVGTDTAAYYSIYNYINSQYFYFSGYRIEPVYIALNKASGYLGFGPFHFLAFISFLSFYFLYVSFARLSCNKVISVSLLFSFSYYFYFYNIVRQGVAISLCCLAIVFLLREREKVFFFLVVLAAGFHATSFVFLVSVFLLRPFPIIFLLLAWVFSLIFLFSSTPVEYLFGYLQSFISRYSSYLDGPSFSRGISLKVFLYQAIYLFFLSSFYVKRARVKPEDRRLLILYNLTFFGIILHNMFYHGGWVSRLSVYYTFFILFSIPLLIGEHFRGRSRMVVSLAVVLLSMLYFIRVIFLAPGGVLPYETGFG